MITDEENRKFLLYLISLYLKLYQEKKEIDDIIELNKVYPVFMDELKIKHQNLKETLNIEIEKVDTLLENFKPLRIKFKLHSLFRKYLFKKVDYLEYIKNFIEKYENTNLDKVENDGVKIPIKAIRLITKKIFELVYKSKEVKIKEKRHLTDLVFELVDISNGIIQPTEAKFEENRKLLQELGILKNSLSIEDERKLNNYLEQEKEIIKSAELSIRDKRKKGNLLVELKYIVKGDITPNEVKNEENRKLLQELGILEKDALSIEEQSKITKAMGELYKKRETLKNIKAKRENTKKMRELYKIRMGELVPTEAKFEENRQLLQELGILKNNLSIEDERKLTQEFLKIKKIIEEATNFKEKWHFTKRLLEIYKILDNKLQPTEVKFEENRRLLQELGIIKIKERKETIKIIEKKENKKKQNFKNFLYKGK